jgi:hypothetical protein
MIPVFRDMSVEGCARIDSIEEIKLEGSERTPLDENPQRRRVAWFDDTSTSNATATTTTTATATATIESEGESEINIEAGIITDIDSLLEKLAKLNADKKPSDLIERLISYKMELLEGGDALKGKEDPWVYFGDPNTDPKKYKYHSKDNKLGKAGVLAPSINALFVVMNRKSLLLKS